MPKYKRSNDLLLFVVLLDLILKLILKLLEKRHLSRVEFAHFCNIVQRIIVGLKFRIAG